MIRGNNCSRVFDDPQLVDVMIKYRINRFSFAENTITNLVGMLVTGCSNADILKNVLHRFDKEDIDFPAYKFKENELT